VGFGAGTSGLQVEESPVRRGTLSICSLLLRAGWCLREGLEKGHKTGASGDGVPSEFMLYGRGGCGKTKGFWSGHRTFALKSGMCCI